MQKAGPRANTLAKAFCAAFLAGIILLYPMHAAKALDSENYENVLLSVVEAMSRGQLSSARPLVEQLLAEYPHSRTAKLLYSDILTAQAGHLPFGDRPGHSRELAALEDLRTQLLIRWRYQSGETRPAAELLPWRFLLPGRSTRHLIYVDLPGSRLYLFKHDEGRLTRLHDYYVTIGTNGIGKQVEGDRRTPVGVYRITSFIPDSALPPRYGPGALPIDYPNSMDRMEQRTGYGIWLHGTEPGYVNRGPNASDGCVSLSNYEFKHLRALAGETFDIPIVLDNDPKWINRTQLRRRRSEAISAIQHWHSSWLKADQKELHKIYRAMSVVSREAALREPRPDRPLSPFTAKWRYPTVPDIELIDYPNSLETFVAQLTFGGKSGSHLVIDQYWQRDAAQSWRVVVERRRIQ